jgi:archaellum biogenesis ATPase FlaH
MMNFLAVIDGTEKELYSQKILPVIMAVKHETDNILFISLNKTYKTLILELKKDNVDLSNYFFIDTITATVIEPVSVDNCLFLPSADNIKNLYDSIIKIVKQKKIGIIIFDSLSSLTTYKNFEEITQLVTLLLGSLSALNCLSMFICLKVDEDSRLIQHVKMNIEKIIYLA